MADIESIQDIFPDSVNCFDEYCKVFVQRAPSYGVKYKDRWTTKHKPLTDTPIRAHLAQQYTIGCLGRWYPEHAFLDFDDMSLDKVQAVRAELGLDLDNSMLFSSESKDSYHLLFKPQYNNRPPTLRLLKNVFRHYIKRHGLEIYPQAHRIARLPFGYRQRPIDMFYNTMCTTWPGFLNMFGKLDEYGLCKVPSVQLEFTYKPLDLDSTGSYFEQGRDLLASGLQTTGTRYESQFKVLYYHWRQNVSMADAIASTWHWIQKHHNGFSRDIGRRPQTVLAEIRRQAAGIYTRYELASIYPDQVHNKHYGYITRADMPEIVQATGGSLPRMRFLFNLVKYAYPRRHRMFVNVHTDLLREWSSGGVYLRYLNELTDKGILKRQRSYIANTAGHGRSKAISFNWRWRDESYVLRSGRSIRTFGDTVRLVFTKDEFRSLLSAQGIDRRTVFMMLRGIWTE